MPFRTLKAVTHTRPEYAICLAILGVLLAIAVPALQRGQFLLGGPTLILGLAFGVWCVVAIVRERG